MVVTISKGMLGDLVVKWSVPPGANSLNVELVDATTGRVPHASKNRTDTTGKWSVVPASGVYFARVFAFYPEGPRLEESSIEIDYQRPQMIAGVPVVVAAIGTGLAIVLLDKKTRRKIFKR